MSESIHLTRRKTLQLAAGGAVLLGLGPMGCVSQTKAQLEDAPEWLLPLAKSESGGRDYAPRIEGQVPKALNGALYRNGPGLYERSGRRKRHLLDGDGLVQRLSFDNGRARYQNAFVQTPKFIAEEEAQRYLYSTWTTRRAGGPLRNLGGGSMAPQAGVTVYPVGDKLYALDEANPIFEIDPQSLDTLGQRVMGERMPNVKAHTKFDPVTGEWLLAGQDFGRTSSIHSVSYNQAGQRGFQQSLEGQPLMYWHDFLISEHYFIFVLHPCELEPFGMLAGLRSVVDSLRWRPEKGNRIVLMPRAGGEPLYYEAEGAFMWHALNAYERGDEIIADIVTYDNPDHFIGENALLHTLMEGKMGNAEEPGKLRRYIINTRTGTLKEEVLDDGNHEFPFVDPRVVAREHRIGYYAYSGIGAMQTGLKRLDMRTGQDQVFDFGPGTHVGEPVFVNQPGGQIDDGWLISQCLDGDSRNTFFALFDASDLVGGPLAIIWLEHSVPLSFHGWWKGLA
ncbi:MAG: carotenoid oxygenase family protein [Saccharospirillum sp.]|nr:carotenoid oxygenase family protein [Saccharospirillum sp.]